MKWRLRIVCTCAVAAAVIGVCASAESQDRLTLSGDMVLDGGALLLPRDAPFGPAVNNIAHQSEALLTVGDYQYATWYHLGPTNEDIYLGRRAISGNTWEVMDTGSDLNNGDGPYWDNHNVTVLGVSGDGALHLAFDHHTNTLSYRRTDPGAATGAVWNASLFRSEQSSLGEGSPAITGVTYPRFVPDPTSDDMYLTYRTGYSGGGDLHIANYNSATGEWGTPHEFIDGAGKVFPAV